MNRYHIVPGDLLDVTNCYNEARCSRDLCPFAQELGTLVSSTSLGRIASTRRRVSWRDNRSPQGVLLPDCPLGPVWLCKINKVDQNVDHICVSVSLVFHRFLTILPMFWVIFWTSSELLLISWQEQWHEIVMDSDQTRRDLTLEVSRREGRPEKLQGVEKWKRKSVPPSHYSWDSSGVKWIQMDSDNAFPHYIQ